MTTAETQTGARPGPRTLRDAWLALAGLSAVFLFEMLDNSILNVALPTIGRQLHASATGLQWVVGAYAVVFGGLMLVFGAIADRFGRRRLMLVGLVVLGLASLATVLIRTDEELVAVRVAMGVAAAMTAPGSMALAFRLFPGNDLRVRAITLISTAGLVGLAVGPTLGGLVLAVAPWQVLLLVDVPVAAFAFVGIRFGIARDDPAGLHRDPIDLLGAALGTVAIVLALLAPTMFVSDGAGSPAPWALTGAAVVALVLFVVRERTARHPLLDLPLLADRLVSSGLAFKAATGIALAGMGYLVTLQLQLDWGWPAALAAIGMLPRVAVLLAVGPFVGRFVERVGLERAGWMSAVAVVIGVGIYAVLGTTSYIWVAIPLMLVAAGLRVNGVVAGTNVLRGLPEERTSIGAALVDTADEVASGVGVAAAGTILAALWTGSISAARWSPAQTGAFRDAVLVGGLILAGTAALLVVIGIVRTVRSAGTPSP